MRPIRLRVGQAQAGMALLYALVTVFLAVSVAGMLLMISFAADADAEVSRYSKQAHYRAEGAVEVARGQVPVALANWNQPVDQGWADVGGVQVPYTIEPADFESIATDSAGIQTILTGYTIRGAATENGHSSIANRIVNARATPLFQFAVFYNNDLEIQPGPDMTLGGRVHSNGDIYLGCGNTLTVDTNYLHARGDIYRRRKDDPSASNGEVLVRRWVENPFDPSEPAVFEPIYSRQQMQDQGISTPSGYDSAFAEGWDANLDGDFDDNGDWLPWAAGALESWSPPGGYTNGSGFTVQTGEHGITEAVTPAINSIQMFEREPGDSGGSHVWDEATQRFVEVAPGVGTHSPGHFHQESDLKILSYLDGTWEAFDGQGFDVTDEVAGAVSLGSFYDARQADGSGAKVQTIEIDMAALNASGVFPTNGLIYAAGYGLDQGTECGGVRLSNGEELLAPLTVVSESPIYVQGDYNTVNKKGASVIGDAVNLLSNAWDDSKRPGQLPYAADTTFNLAFITGNHDTVGSAYNGGLENLPRFHEKWSGKNCNIVGSLVNTWTSGLATGEWKYGGDRYTAPRRNWSYDTAFNNIANLPPFTPMAVSAEDVVSWDRLRP